MKLKYLLIALTCLMMLVSCTHEQQSFNILLEPLWKFKSGDNLAWTDPEAEDSTWSLLSPNKPWERQGLKGYDGFAWYRYTVVIPSSLKESSFFHDTLQISLGRIDDCDQVFLNGEIIGENGTTIYDSRRPDTAFTEVWGFWNTPRSYLLSVNDPRLGGYPRGWQNSDQR